MTSSSGKVRLLCSVHGCGQELVRNAREWTCRQGHGFDIGRSGYVNLLQPGDRRSRSPGEPLEVVAARARLEERGFGREWRGAIESQAAALVRGDGETALDVGAGTGLLLGQLAARLGLEGWALDISVHSVRFGSRRRPELAWIVANGDRNLPFEDGAFALVVSNVGPKNPGEFRRILAPEGTLLLVVPAPDDLLELRQVVLGEGRQLDHAARALEQFAPWLRCVDRTTVRTKRWLDRSALDDFLATTYRGARRAQNERLGDLDALETTSAAEILCFVHR